MASKTVNEFREFAFKGNVIDMAVGIIIGAAFALVIKSLVDDVLMPPVGLLLGGTDLTNAFVVLREGALPGPYRTLQEATEAGAVTLRYGLFVNAVINFLIIAFSIFITLKVLLRAKSHRVGPTPTASG